VGKFFSAGEWTVKQGHDEEAFVAAWLGSVDVDPPIGGLVARPRLLRDLNRPGRFLSFAEWESHEAIKEFRSRPDFPTMIGRIREHADFEIFTLEHVAGG
jgi:heme-degrading monooxygenase HmoA